MRNDKILTIDGSLEYKDLRYLNEDNPWDHWDSMPHYDPKDIIDDYMTIEVEFEDAAALSDFIAKSGVSITDKTKSIWYPQKEINRYLSKRYVCDFYDSGSYKPENMPKYPIYIPSKGRWDVRMTSDALIKLGIKHFMIVEQSQLHEYVAKVDPNFVQLLVLPQEYLDSYDTCDDLGASKSKGPGAARNFAWDHSIGLGFDRHWVMDDNQSPFYRHDTDQRTPTMSAAIFRAMEDHTDRYENVYISGPHYRFFVVPHDNLPPFVPNCRIYSCLLIKNDIPFRWRGRYNEDTDLSLRVLKSGACTIQYNAFTTGKIVTQALAGGNTAEFYSKEGTLPKSKMIEDLHPDVCKVQWMNGRWHHWCDYAPYKSNRLKLKVDYYKNSDPEYGMRYVEIETKEEHDD